MKKGLGYLNKVEVEVISSLVTELKEKLGDEILSIPEKMPKTKLIMPKSS